MGNWVSEIMLITKRKFIIEQKWIFKKAIKAYADALPEPTKENTLEPNSHVLLDIRDKKFRKYYDFERNKELMEAVWKIAIDENEHDPHYRDIFLGWLVEEIVEAVMDGRWQPRPSRHLSGHWKEPRTEDNEKHGKYRGRKFARFIGK